MFGVMSPTPNSRPTNYYTHSSSSWSCLWNYSQNWWQLSCVQKVFITILY